MNETLITQKLNAIILKINSIITNSKTIEEHLELSNPTGNEYLLVSDNYITKKLKLLKITEQVNAQINNILNSINNIQSQINNNANSIVNNQNEINNIKNQLDDINDSITDIDQDLYATTLVANSNQTHINNILQELNKINFKLYNCKLGISSQFKTADTELGYNVFANNNINSVLNNSDSIPTLFESNFDLKILNIDINGILENANNLKLELNLVGINKYDNTDARIIKTIILDFSYAAGNDIKVFDGKIINEDLYSDELLGIVWRKTQGVDTYIYNTTININFNKI